MTERYRLIEKPSRVFAVDANDVEIAGARQPFGHDNWVIYTTVRLTENLHQVLALTRDAAVEHVRMLADLYTRQHLQAVWTPGDSRELLARAGHFDAVDCSGSLADVGPE